MPAGRPSKFTDEMFQTIIDLTSQGKTLKQVSDIVGVSVKTLSMWRVDDLEFSEALKKARDVADNMVQATLFQRATGYSHRAVKLFYDPKSGEVIEHEYTEHYPPDTTAMIFWLKNRRPDEWREKKEDQISNSNEIGSAITEMGNKILDATKKIQERKRK